MSDRWHTGRYTKEGQHSLFIDHVLCGKAIISDPYTLDCIVPSIQVELVNC